GNFSFSSALLTRLHGASALTATSYDPEPVALQKYPDLDAHVSAVREMGGTVLFGVDATELEKCKPLRGMLFDKIVFNFPHVGAGIKDQERNVIANQNLIRAFFVSAAAFLRPSTSTTQSGRILLTTKTGMPYDLWDVRAQAKLTGELELVESFLFESSLYEGYAHRRTIGFKEGVSSEENEEIRGGDGPRTFAFGLKEEVAFEEEEEIPSKGKKRDVKGQGGTAKKRKKGDESSDDED
ncbi:hypothetical protein BDK51DRAFT_19525, partial [Blyttiomyces helicus]